MKVELIGGPFDGASFLPWMKHDPEAYVVTHTHDGQVGVVPVTKKRGERGWQTMQDKRIGRPDPGDGFEGKFEGSFLYVQTTESRAEFVGRVG